MGSRLRPGMDAESDVSITCLSTGNPTYRKRQFAVTKESWRALVCTAKLHLPRQLQNFFDYETCEWNMESKEGRKICTEKSGMALISEAIGSDIA